MTNLPYEGATSEQLQSPMVREFLSIHNMFRNQLRGMLEYIQDLTSGEQSLTGAETQAQIRALIQTGAQYTRLLHFHHHGETDSLFPALEQEGLESSIVARLNKEHDEIGSMIDSFNVAIQHLATIEPDVLNSDLRRLADALHAHLAYEETHVCPLLARWTHWHIMH